MDSMDSLNGKMDSCSKMEGDAKISPEKVATAAIKANSSNRAERSVNRRQEKRRDAMRNYSKNWYANQSDEQKKEKAKKRKKRKQDKGEKEKKYGNRMLLKEQHINNCFPHKQNDVGTALCATTEIPKGGLIGQYLGGITREGKHRPKSNYTGVMVRPDNENGCSNLWVDSEKCGI